MSTILIGKMAKEVPVAIVTELGTWTLGLLLCSDHIDRTGQVASGDNTFNVSGRFSHGAEVLLTETTGESLTPIV